MAQVVFEIGSAPPPIPTDPFFKLGVTTLYLRGEPWRIASDLFRFFEARGVVSKVRTTKYAMTVAIFNEVFQYVKIKIRIYNLTSAYAVEFQRRAGDIVLFSAIYDKAAAFLENPTLFVPIEQAPIKIEAELLNPLIDMLDSNVEALQAEACAALACFSCETLDPRVTHRLEELSFSSDVAVSFPAASLLTRLQALGRMSQFHARA